MNARIAEPPIGGTIDHILSVLPSLIPSAQRVARICADRPEEVVEMSGADLAAAAETSPPTVTRTCQALGFQGFQHLRMLLVRDLGAVARASRSREAGTAGWLQSIADGAGDILRTSLASVDAAAFDAAADAIVAAPRVLLTGTGASGPAAQSIALKLTMNGRPCEAPVDGVSQQLTARVLRPGDVCVVVSSSGANAVTLAAAAAAREAGATVIGVTSFSRSALADHTDILLVAGARFQSWDQGAVGAGLVQYLLLSVLQLAVADRMDGDDAERARGAIRDELGAIVAEPNGSEEPRSSRTAS
ncbi:RpiR family carbohydrate utilization transcriptional regulator [Microbacterium sp. ZKA21]|uniref:MurR/RpiR family transcriptional regulator n=1 Tax=Microbacterium sp. ZKA21 TaxID=3381694 RepID=UPI003D1A1E6B